MSVQRNTEAPIHEPMLIAGRRVDGPARIEVRNPARPDELVGTIVRGTPEHVNAAVAAAKSAQPAWAARSFTERAAILAAGLDRLEADIDPRRAVDPPAGDQHGLVNGRFGIALNGHLSLLDPGLLCTTISRCVDNVLVRVPLK